LEEVGEILHLARSGRLIVRLATGIKKINDGELLIDIQGKRIGKVTEVIGPVSAPYASAIPLTDKINRIIGTKVFNGGFLTRKKDFKSNKRGASSGRHRK